MMNLGALAGHGLQALDLGHSVHTLDHIILNLNASVFIQNSMILILVTMPNRNAKWSNNAA